MDNRYAKAHAGDAPYNTEKDSKPSPRGKQNMALRTDILTWSKGDLMETYWKVFFKRQNTTSGWKRDLYTIFLNRSARKHGGYIGKDTTFASRPRLPHGLHGIYISRYAALGEECWIYQNVTIGEVNGKAPVIGNNVFIGANAAIVGDIKIGNNVTIGAGALVVKDVPDNAKVLSQPARIVLCETEEAKKAETEEPESAYALTARKPRAAAPNKPHPDNHDALAHAKADKAEETGRTFELPHIPDAE